MIIIYTKWNNETFKVDISKLISNFSWSGSIEQSCRQFSFDLINPQFDRDLLDSIPEIETGDYISLYTDTDYAIPMYLCFYGKVQHVIKSSENGTVKIQCVDLLVNLSRCTINRYYRNTTAEAITKSILSEYGYTIQNIENTGVSLGEMTFEDKTALEIIQESYAKASKLTGLKYYMSMDGNKFYVQHRGFPLLSIKLSDGIDDTEGGLVNNNGKGISFLSTLEDDTQEMVNRVKVYSKEGQFIKQFENEEDIKRYGVFEKPYYVKDEEDTDTTAKGLLVSKKRVINFDVLGDPNFWSGRSVMVHDRATHLDGWFLITEDNHTWEDGKYVTKLTLEYLGLTPKL